MGRASRLDAEGVPGAEAGPCLDSSFSWETLAVLKPLSPYSPSPNFPEVSSHSEESHPTPSVVSHSTCMVSAPPGSTRLSLHLEHPGALD